MAPKRHSPHTSSCEFTMPKCWGVGWDVCVYSLEESSAPACAKYTEENHKTKQKYQYGAESKPPLQFQAQKKAMMDACLHEVCLYVVASTCSHSPSPHALPYSFVFSLASATGRRLKALSQSGSVSHRHSKRMSLRRRQEEGASATHFVRWPTVGRSVYVC